jgi:aminoglycoside 3-N-acetyltransferase
VSDFPPGPLVTRASLAADLRRLGLRRDDVVLVHTSLSRLGWVCGGPVAAVQALLDVVGTVGTVVVPTQSGDNSDPATWQRPPVPAAWWQPIRDHTPAYDPAVTPTRGMGRLPETLRTWPGALRSAHPTTSFAAVGGAAAAVVATHDLDCQLGDRSPLRTLERLDAKVLLLGAGYASATAFHLAEYRLPDPPRARNGSAVMTDDGRRWVEWDDVDLDEEGFDRLGAAYEQSADDEVAVGTVGAATCRLFPVRSAVAFAVRWLGEHRDRRAS